MRSGRFTRMQKTPHRGCRRAIHGESRGRLGVGSSRMTLSSAPFRARKKVLSRSPTRSTSMVGAACSQVAADVAGQQAAHLLDVHRLLQLGQVLRHPRRHGRISLPRAPRSPGSLHRQVPGQIERFAIGRVPRKRSHAGCSHVGERPSKMRPMTSNTLSDRKFLTDSSILLSRVCTTRPSQVLPATRLRIATRSFF